MTKPFININHELVPADMPVFTAANRGFRYGDGLFESMRMMNGKLKFADLHADRIQRGMKAFKIDGYSQLDAAFLQQNLEFFENHADLLAVMHVPSAHGKGAVSLAEETIGAMR